MGNQKRLGLFMILSLPQAECDTVKVYKIVKAHTGKQIQNCYLPSPVVSYGHSLKLVGEQFKTCKRKSFF